MAYKACKRTPAERTKSNSSLLLSPQFGIVAHPAPFSPARFRYIESTFSRLDDTEKSGIMRMKDDDREQVGGFTHRRDLPDGARQDG